MSQHRIADISVVLTLAILALLYALDWYRASDHILNTILVLPLTAIILVCCAGQLFLQVKSGKDPEKAEPVTEQLPIMILFTAYVAGLNWLGFDVGTFLFVAGCLWLQGERRLPWLIGYSLVFASLCACFFLSMLPYPMPMLVLGGLS